MKPPKFHVGQAVVCILHESKWDRPLVDTPPKRGKIYTICEIETTSDPKRKWWQFWLKLTYLRLAEKPFCRWQQEAFQPVELLPDAALTELLAETLEPVTA